MDQLEKFGASKAGSTTSGTLESATDHVKAAAAETSALAAEKLGVLADSARSLGEDWLATLSTTIERKPITAVAIAAGVGLIAGWMTRR